MDWKTYPENKPECSGEYLISTREHVMLSYFSMMEKQYDSEGNKFYGEGWKNEGCGGFHKGVDAFMEKPKPFKSEQ